MKTKSMTRFWFSRGISEKAKDIVAQYAVSVATGMTAQMSCADGGLWTGMVSRGYIEVKLPRIECPEHEVKTAGVSWAFPGFCFSRDFEYTVAWMDKYLSRSAIAKYMRIDWGTTGRCISRVHNDIEPDMGLRLDGLEEIGIDETSYQKGHKYMTVVVNHKTNSVVWASLGHGKEVLNQFMHLLTEEQRKSIKVVSGDGARWITDCVNENLPYAERCIDLFHVVEWTNEALNEVRIEAWHRANERVQELSQSKCRKGPGRPKKSDKEAKAVKAAMNAACEVKGAKYALCKAPENLTVDNIQVSDKALYRAYLLKETLRRLLKLTDSKEAAAALKKWIQWARRCRITKFEELQKKIMRHWEHILNTIRLGVSNARVEATNNKINLLIR